MRYIELNPVRAGIVRHAGEYAWSSYRQNASGMPGKLLSPHEFYLRLGKPWAPMVSVPRWLLASIAPLHRDLGAGPKRGQIEKLT